MSNRMIKQFVLGAMICLCAEPVLAADNVALHKDLTSVIALLGLSCGQGVSVIPQGKDDNIAVCKVGNRYRVYINPEGRVVAKKQ